MNEKERKVFELIVVYYLMQFYPGSCLRCDNPGHRCGRFQPAGLRTAGGFPGLAPTGADRGAVR